MHLFTILLSRPEALLIIDFYAVVDASVAGAAVVGASVVGAAVVGG